MKFELEDGDHTVIFFYRDRQGMTHPFPLENANIVSSRGTGESKEMLDKILMDGVTVLRDRMYVTFMGPQIPPYKIRCYCGHVVKVVHDESDYYIEEAAEIIFEPREKIEESEGAQPREITPS